VCLFLGIDIGKDYLSAASRWLLKEKCYSVNFISICCGNEEYLANKK
jgi:hypothetical protein